MNVEVNKAVAAAAGYKLLKVKGTGVIMVYHTYHDNQSDRFLGYISEQKHDKLVPYFDPFNNTDQAMDVLSRVGSWKVSKSSSPNKISRFSMTLFTEDQSWISIGDTFCQAACEAILAATSNNRSTTQMTQMEVISKVLINRYLEGMLDAFITNYEVHKLMYFMQESGEPLGLKFNPSKYGPTAEHLPSYVLPSRMKPEPIKVKELLSVLSSSTYQRIKRISDLIDGYETSVGLELLSLVHWIVQRNPKLSLNDLANKSIYRPQVYSETSCTCMEPPVCERVGKVTLRIKMKKLKVLTLFLCGICYGCSQTPTDTPMDQFDLYYIEFSWNRTQGPTVSMHGRLKEDDQISLYIYANHRSRRKRQRESMQALADWMCQELDACGRKQLNP